MSTEQLKNRSKNMKIIAESAFDAYKKCFIWLFSGSPDVPDPELFREAPGVLMINPKEDRETPLRVVNESFLGNVSYDQYIRGGDAVFAVVRSHYERTLLQTGLLAEIVEFLRKHPSSKRAVVSVWNKCRPDRSSDDPCLVYLWFRIRNGQLDCHAHLRANDVYRKLLMNMHIFLAIQDHVSSRLGLSSGIYYHICDSFHFYMDDKPCVTEGFHGLSGERTAFAVPPSKPHSPAWITGP